MDIHSRGCKINNYNLINAYSDGACFVKQNEKLDIIEVKRLVSEFNKTIPNGIEVEFESFMPALVVSKAKNYAFVDTDGKVTIKGSSFKSSSKEIALKEMCEVMLKSMLGLVEESPVDIYHRYVTEAANIIDINRWASKTTYTQAVVKAGRLQEQKKKKASEGLDLDVGDKFYTYIKPDEWLGNPDEYDGTYHIEKYVKKVFNSAKTLASVIDIKQFPNYGLKTNKEKLQQLTG